MKKYHLIRLHQVTSYKGYIKFGEKYNSMIAFRIKEDNYKPEAASTVVDLDKIIMVEKISKGLVREVKTGIIFPIVNLKSKQTSEGTFEYMYCPFPKVHTFVCSRDNKLLSKEVNSSIVWEEYDKLYPNVKVLKEELLEIIKRGKSNFDAKIESEKLIKKEQKEQEKESKRTERLKVRRLKRQFKQERKTK